MTQALGSPASSRRHTTINHLRKRLRLPSQHKALHFLFSAVKVQAQGGCQGEWLSGSSEAGGEATDEELKGPRGRRGWVPPPGGHGAPTSPTSSLQEGRTAQQRTQVVNSNDGKQHPDHREQSKTATDIKYPTEKSSMEERKSALMQ